MDGAPRLSFSLRGSCFARRDRSRRLAPLRGRFLAPLHRRRLARAFLFRGLARPALRAGGANGFVTSLEHWFGLARRRLHRERTAAHGWSSDSERGAGGRVELLTLRQTV